MKRSVKILIAILLLTLGALIIDIPQDLPVKFSIANITVDTKISPPSIDFFVFGTRIKKSFETRLGLDLQGGTQLVLEVQTDEIDENSRDTALESAREIIERRVNFYGLAEPVVQSAKVADSYRIIVELPGISEVDQAIATIGQTAQLEFREFTDSTPSALPTLGNTRSVDIAGKDLKSASVTFQTAHTGGSEPVVQFSFTKEGGEKFAEVTTRLIGRPLVIFLDDVPLTWPIVQTPITTGQGIISGGFTSDEAKRLSLQLSAGALPAPIEVIEQRTIGATLGKESVTKSITAGIIGLLIVALFMVLYYGNLGVLAVFALVIYGLLSFAIFRAIPITLTLPGIAGFVLSIGMAVDSNILIFERIKEELRDGKPWYLAQELGFGKAWDSIRDANFTTLLTAFILFNPLNFDFLPVSGAVRGFALTLTIGVLTSLFTGVVVTRTFIRVLFTRNAQERLATHIKNQS